MRTTNYLSFSVSLVLIIFDVLKHRFMRMTSYRGFGGNPYGITYIRLNENIVSWEWRSVEVLVYIRLLIILNGYKYSERG